MLDRMRFSHRRECKPALDGQSAADHVLAEESTNMNETELDGFIRRYVAMWHEPDVARRRAIVESLFATDAEDVMQRTVCRGIDEIAARVTRAHDEWVAAKHHAFSPTGNAASHHHLVKFLWKMAPAGGGPAVSYGLDVFVLNDAGRIRSLYQFIEPPPSTT
jgi:hypothetical protein